MGDFLSIVVAVALFPKDGLQMLHTEPAGGVQMEELTHYGSFILINNQLPAVLVIAEDSAVPQNNSVFNGLSEPELYPFGQLAQLALSQAELRVPVCGVDVAALEVDSCPHLAELTGILNGIQSVSGKAGDLLCYDQIKAPGFAIGDHPIEVFLLPGGSC